eukprot:COSAG06_NODE_309_length_17782_cov_49.326698_17_plen_184_part_00
MGREANGPAARVTSITKASANARTEGRLAMSGEPRHGRRRADMWEGWQEPAVEQTRAARAKSVGQHGDLRGAPVTLQSASFFIHLAKMDIHEDRWPRHLHLVHLVLPTVHLLYRSRSQHRAGAPAPIAAPRWQGGLQRAYQPRLARRKLPSSARVAVPDVLRVLLRAHRLQAAGVCGVCMRRG